MYFQHLMYLQLFTNTTMISFTIIVQYSYQNHSICNYMSQSCVNLHNLHDQTVYKMRYLLSISKSYLCPKKIMLRGKAVFNKFCTKKLTFVKNSQNGRQTQVHTMQKFHSSVIWCQCSLHNTRLVIVIFGTFLKTVICSVSVPNQQYANKYDIQHMFRSSTVIT